jgi:hypothetical protein
MNPGLMQRKWIIFSPVLVSHILPDAVLLAGDQRLLSAMTTRAARSPDTTAPSIVARHGCLV